MYGIVNVMSGSLFNELHPNSIFYKLTNAEENHNGLMYHAGLVIDNKPFLPKSTCDGGIYFCKQKFICRWVFYRDQKMKYIRRVIIPNDAQVVIEDKHKMKTNKFILGDRVNIWTEPTVYELILTKRPEFWYQLPIEWLSEDICFYVLVRHPEYLSVFPLDHISSDLLTKIITTNKDSLLFLNENNIPMALLQMYYDECLWKYSHQLKYLPNICKKIPKEALTEKFWLGALEINIDVYHQIPHLSKTIAIKNRFMELNDH